MMKQVLSIQSSVTAGFVGNTVAGPVLTALGQHPMLVDTVTLAAHPGYGKRAGGAVPDDILAAVLDGILSLTDTSGINIVTSGYLGSAHPGGRHRGVCRWLARCHRRDLYPRSGSG